MPAPRDLTSAQAGLQVRPVILITTCGELPRTGHRQLAVPGRLADGQRTFRVAGGEPLPASYGPGRYGQVPASMDETATA